MSKPRSVEAEFKERSLLLPVNDLYAGHWAKSRLDSFHSYNVASLVPRGFARYARILHPDWKSGGLQRFPLMWADVAARNGRRCHALMQWPRIAGSMISGIDIEPPDEGTLPWPVSGPLRAILSGHTDWELCWFGMWSSYGQYYQDYVPKTKSIEFHTGTGHEWDLYRAPLSMLGTSFIHLGHETAGLVWANDRSWWMSASIELHSSYIGGTTNLIEDILSAPELETWPSSPDDIITFDSDTLNSQ